MEQAMSMLLTGGAVAPERIVFSSERENIVTSANSR